MLKYTKSRLIFAILLCIIVLIIVLLIKFINQYEGFELNKNIPKVIYLSYKTKDIPSYIIPNWKKLYPDYEIKLYDNQDCIDFLSKEYGQEFVDLFNYIQDGPIKADFWRLCMLYKYGGIYSDIDVEPLVNIETILEKDVSFLTCVSAIKNQLNPHFIISKPNHDILKQCIDKYIEMYRNKISYSYWTYSIVTIFEKIIKNLFNEIIDNDGIYFDNKNQKYQMLKEVYPEESSNKEHYCKYKNIKVLNNRYKTYDSEKHTF